MLWLMRNGVQKLTKVAFSIQIIVQWLFNMHVKMNLIMIMIVPVVTVCNDDVDDCIDEGGDHGSVMMVIGYDRTVLMMMVMIFIYFRCNGGFPEAAWYVYKSKNSFNSIKNSRNHSLSRHMTYLKTFEVYCHMC